MRKFWIVLACFAQGAWAQDWFPSKYGARRHPRRRQSPLAAEGGAGLAAGQDGKTYPLGVVTGWDTPAYPPRQYAITVIQPGQDSGPTMGANRATGNDDLLYTWMGIGSQLDGLGHMGEEHVYYNGHKASDFVTPKG